MLCHICTGLHFKPLSEWQRPDQEISDISNSAFQQYYTSDRAAEEWQNGEGMLVVYYFHHPSATDLLASASKGCYLCAMISFALFRKDNHLKKGESLLLPNPPAKDKPIVLTLFLNQKCRSWQTVEQYEFIRVFCGSLHARLDSLEQFTATPLTGEQYKGAGAELERAWMEKRMEPLLSTWSPLNQKLAKSWYRSCLRYHEDCADGSSLPRRVIDLGESCEQSQPILIEPNEQSQAKYITLSHCWGDTTRMTITRDECKAFWTLPPFLEWPQVFQDAVVVARTFCIRYIWIDSICIMQDSAVDWEIESGKMAQYYSGSAFTIAAACAASSSESLFVRRNPVMTFPYHLEIDSEPINGKKFKRHLSVATEEVFPGETEGSPASSTLYSRGWVLQEEVLSPRVLRFGRKGIYWQCRSQFQSEAILIHENARPKREVETPLQIAPLPSTQGWTYGRDRHHEVWYKLLTTFNGRNITYQDDILPSLSGISQIVHSCLSQSDVYLAGMWQSDLSVGLLWSRVSAYTFRPEIASNRLNFERRSFFSPSWSWVSQAHRTLNFQLHPKILPPGGVLLHEAPDTEFVHAAIDLQNELSPYGSVKFGALTFASKCPPITIFLNRKPTVKVSSETAVLEFRGTSLSDEGLFRDMEASSADLPHWLSPQYDSGIVTGDCILDDESGFLQRYNPFNYAHSNILGRLRTQIHAVFLPLLNFDPEDGREWALGHRVLGLALVPVQSPAERAREVAKSHGPDVRVYRRIGRAALNVHVSRLRASTIAKKLITII